jgi:lactobin A/cerein 7B family class IIb bacteriocin
MLNEASGICALTDDELDEVNGGVGLVVSVLCMVGALAAGLVVGTYLKHQDQAASGGSKPGDYPTSTTATA